MPMIGMLIALATCHTILTATGKTAAPLRPPVLLRMMGRRVRMSMRMPVRVLIMETASAPSASAACAMDAMSVTLGLSLTTSGFLQ